MAHEPIRNRKRAAILTYGGLFLLLAATAGGLIFASLDLPAQPQRLADGSTFSFLGVTTPNQPELVTGPPLYRLLAPILTDGQEQSLGVRRLKHKHGPLNLWLKQSGVAALSPSARLLAPFDFQKPVDASDERGNLASLPYSMQQWSFDFLSRPEYHGLVIGILPRRGKELTLRIYDPPHRANGEPFAQFRIANPLYGQFPEWTAQPLPARQMMGEVEVQLLSLRTGLRHPGQAKDSSDAEMGIWTRAAFAVHQRGRHSADWVPTGVAVRDATGNHWVSRVDRDQEEAGRPAVFFGGNLWDEPAWKLTATFARVSGFAPGNVGDAGATLPRRGISDTRSEPVNLREMSLCIASLVARGSSHWVKFGSSIEGPQVIVDLEGDALDKQLRLVGVSAPGFNWKGSVTSGMFPPRRRCFRLPDETPSGPVRLRFALDESRKATFIVRPEPSAVATVR